MSFFSSLAQSLSDAVDALTAPPSPSPSPSPSVSRPPAAAKATSSAKPNAKRGTLSKGANNRSGGREQRIAAPSPLKGSLDEAEVVSPVALKLTHAQRVHMFDQWREQRVLDVDAIRRVAFEYGLPDGSLRALYWRVLLGLLPHKTEHWPAVLAERRESYASFHRELRIDPHAREELERSAPVQEALDHPLSQESSSEWRAFFRDGERLFEIEKDVLRTFPHLHFFQAAPPTDDEERSPQQEREAALANPHYRALRGILFLYAKLNPGVGYVQGMNELLGPIYYAFATDSAAAWRAHAEADAFFCFTQLMSECMNGFLKTLDESRVGIRGQMAELNALLCAKDRRVWAHLEAIGVHAQFYSFRWLTLLLSQEFELPDVLRLWDTLLADPRRFVHARFVCVAMVVRIRERLLEADFATALRVLQNYPKECTMEELLELAKVVAHEHYAHADVGDVTEPLTEKEEAEAEARRIEAEVREAEAKAAVKAGKEAKAAKEAEDLGEQMVRSNLVDFLL